MGWKFVWIGDLAVCDILLDFMFGQVGDLFGLSWDGGLTGLGCWLVIWLGWVGHFVGLEIWLGGRVGRIGYLVGFHI